MDYILFNIYMVILTLLGQISAYRYDETDRATRFITWNAWLGMICEVLGRVSARMFHTNTLIYSVGCLIEMGLICMYYNYSIRTLKKYRIGYIIMALSAASWIINHVWFQSILVFNTNFHVIECILIVSLSLYAIYKVLKSDNGKVPIYRKTLFWIPIVLLLYQCGALWSWLSAEYFMHLDRKTSELAAVLMLSVGITVFSMLTLVYLFLPKLEKTYA